MRDHCEVQRDAKLDRCLSLPCFYSPQRRFLLSSNRTRWPFRLRAQSLRNPIRWCSACRLAGPLPRLWTRWWVRCRAWASPTRISMGLVIQAPLQWGFTLVAPLSKLSTTIASLIKLAADHRTKQQRPDVDVHHRGNAGIAAIAAIAIVLERRSCRGCNRAGSETGSRGWINAGADTPGIQRACGAKLRGPKYCRTPGFFRLRRFLRILVRHSCPLAGYVLAPCQISIAALILTLTTPSGRGSVTPLITLDRRD